MAEIKNFGETVGSLFGGLTDFMTTKTVVGDAVQVRDNIIIPLVEVSFGVGASAYDKHAKKDGAIGGMGAKMKPAAVLLINGNSAKMIPVDQPKDAVSRVIDLVPDIVNRFSKHKADPEVDRAVKEAAEGADLNK